MVLTTVAVTGAGGMLGRQVVSALISGGIRVVPIVRPDAGRSQQAAWDLGDWKGMDGLDVLFNGVDAVVHAGAAVPRPGQRSHDAVLYDVNVRACTALAMWARARKKPLVHISGAIVYANPGRTGIREDDRIGISGLGGFYGLTKLLAEDVLRREEERGLQLAILRPTSIYGPRMAAGKMLPSFLRTAKQGGTIRLTPPTDDRVDFIHAADVADAVVRILKRGAWNTFNVGSERLTSISELADTCVRVVGGGQVAVQAADEPAPHGSTRFAVSCARAKDELGWSARIDIVAGVESLVVSDAQAGGVFPC